MRELVQRKICCPGKQTMLVAWRRSLFHSLNPYKHKQFKYKYPKKAEICSIPHPCLASKKWLAACTANTRQWRHGFGKTSISHSWKGRGARRSREHEKQRNTTRICCKGLQSIRCWARMQGVDAIVDVVFELPTLVGMDNNNMPQNNPVTCSCSSRTTTTTW